MKKILLLLIANAIIGFVYSQNIQLLSGEEDLTNQEITVWGDVEESVFQKFVTTKNVGTEAMSLKVKKEELEVVDGSENYFCWLLCYASDTEISPYAINLEPGAITGADGFSGDYKSHGNLGTTKIKYTFFNEENEDENVTLIINYSAVPVGVEFIKINEISKIYPNPANNSINLNYNLKENSSANIVIFNILGNEIKKFYLDNFKNKISIDVSDLKNGVYFYSITIDNKIKETKKLIIKHF